MRSEVKEGFGGTKLGVGVGTLGHLFATDCILLVSEGQRSGEDLRLVDFIQSAVGGEVHSGSAMGVGSYGDCSIAKAEGLGAFSIPREGVFRGAKEPVEGDDGEVDDMGIDRSVFGVRGVQGFAKTADDGNVGRVGAFGRVVLFFHPFEERR